MKTTLVAALALAASVTSWPAHADDTMGMVGWVSDGHCTVDHMKEGGAACVRKCIAGATHVNPDWKPGGMVLVTDDKKVWKVDNADALWGLEESARRNQRDAERQSRFGESVEGSLTEEVDRFGPAQPIDSPTHTRADALTRRTR